MKLFINAIYIFIITCYPAFSQNNNDTKIALDSKLLIGEIYNDEIVLRINKDVFIKEINRSMFGIEEPIDNLTIKSDYTLGDKKIKYYFLNLSSSQKNLNIVRWLFNYDGKLYIDKSYNSENFTYVDFYIGCEGNSSCKPRLFIYNSEYSWACREFPACVSDEEAKLNPCKQTATVF